MPFVCDMCGTTSGRGCGDLECFYFDEYPDERFGFGFFRPEHEEFQEDFQEYTDQEFGPCLVVGHPLGVVWLPVGHGARGAW